MRARDQIIGAAALAVVTYFGVLRIAAAKCDETVGSRGIRIDRAAPVEYAAFERLQGQLAQIGEGELADRLEALRARNELWAAPGLGPERWAAYVESLGLVKRIYIRRVALLNPVAHLYPGGASGVPGGYQEAYAWLSLGGAMRHELAHRDGAIEEGDAYREEIAWYQRVAASAFIGALEGEERAAWDWALESAMASARKAAEKAGAGI